MNRALDRLAVRGEEPIYSELLLKQPRTKFQYPTTALLLYLPVRHVIEFAGLNERRTLARLGLALVLGIAVTTAILFARLTDVQPSFACIAVALIAAATFYPIAWGVVAGQIQTWINAIFALALLTWVSGRAKLSGALIGLMCLIKPQYGVFVIWGAVRREWGFVTTLLTVCVLGIAAAAAVFGTVHIVDYAKALSFLSQHGEAYFSNQSINGILNRIMGLWEPELYNNLKWRQNAFPPYSCIVHLGTLLAGLTLLTCAIVAQEKDRAIGFSIIALSITIASPIAWRHHYGVLFPIYAVALAALLEDRKAIYWLAVSYLLTSNFFAVFNKLAGTPFNILQSHMFAGAIILLLLLYRAGTNGSIRFRWIRQRTN